MNEPSSVWTYQSVWVKELVSIVNDCKSSTVVWKHSVQQWKKTVQQCEKTVYNKVKNELKNKVKKGEKTNWQSGLQTGTDRTNKDKQTEKRV